MNFEFSREIFEKSSIQISRKFVHWKQISSMRADRHDETKDGETQ